VRVTGLTWPGTRTARAGEPGLFYGRVLQLPTVHKEEGFSVFELPAGRHLEVIATT
jgi:hypothetical protein